MLLKTIEMRRILEPIEAQVQQLRGLLSTKNPEIPDTVMDSSSLSEELHTLADELEKLLSNNDCNDSEEMKSKIVALIGQFCSTNKNNNLVMQLHKVDSQDLVSDILDKFTSALEALEKLECLPLKQSLQDSWDYVKDMGAEQEIEDFQNIKELGASIVEVFSPLQKFRKSLASYLLSQKVALYSSQLCAALNVLFLLIQEQHQLNSPIYSCKKYACDRMSWCFKMLVNVLDAPNPTAEEENFEKENHFVYRMDLALDILAEMSTKTGEDQILDCEYLWSALEDVFAHAMAIAQVCHPYNFNAITGVSQSIITEYESLKAQLTSEKPDPSINNLYMNTLNDALYRLEQKVNVSVLTLVMEVFSDPYGALRKLIKTCGNSLAAQERSRIDLSTAIEEFDQTTDKAMQIGMFAIACCKDMNRVTKIRTCLASLESLEPELVPATTAFYLHPDNKEMRATVKLLTGQWQLEMNKLHKLVDVIVDSGAYCQVILDDIQQRVMRMSEYLDNREGVTQAQVQGVVQRALSLSSQIDATVEDIGRDQIERPTIMMIQELKAAIYEAGMASKILLDSATEAQQLRVIKRCELILNVIKRLQPALVALINSSTSMHTSYGKASMGQGDTLHDPGLTFSADIYGFTRNERTFTYIRTPYTVNSNKQPLSIQPANSSPRTPTNQSRLIPYIKRGRTMRTDRSIMYKTPKADVKEISINSEETFEANNQSRTRNLSIVRQHLFSRDSFDIKQDIDMNSESFDLTGILDKITCLSDTLSSTLSISCSPGKVQSTKDMSLPEVKASRDITESIINVERDASLTNLGESMAADRIDQCSTIGGGDAPSAIDTPERIEDLKRLDKKIQVLIHQKISAD
ncbi:uncharacterized protein LOC124182544 isoform X1 [Neodiprion fabricii]|uniref:uncharacterized protein LOC124182544 isoform X1 n=1 Tax=Neodiprion fabricii TaxID=2872261 RepID=UPI001ED93115|nr:uncharacterized protein LOC124182544 isoform X1 [Neodiprion fabricii]